MLLLTYIRITYDIRHRKFDVAYLLGKMASCETDALDVIKFGYVNYKLDPSSKMQVATCKRCKAVIKEKLGTASTFVRHLSISTHEGLHQE